MYIQSADLVENKIIPIDFTCDGADVSPSLDLKNSPPNSKSFALIMEELDSPSGSFVHWLLYNWKASLPHLDKRLPHTGTLKNGARQGLNDFDEIGYNGPCPTSGTHRYVIKLYALDDDLNLNAGAAKEELLEAMQGHILEESYFFAEYSRTKALEMAQSSGKFN